MKNPWLSLWLSGANAWAGAARGFVAAEMARNQNALMREAAKQATAFWLPQRAATPKPAPKRRRATRRR